MKEISSGKECRDIFSTIKQLYPKLSKSHKLIADFMFSHYEQVSEMSACKVAKSIDVSEATVVRFSVALGFEGYPEFRRALKNELKSKLTTVERIDMSLRNEEKEKALQETVQNVLKSDISNIGTTFEEFDYENFKSCIDLILAARKVIIIGFRTTSLLTEHLGYYLNLILDNVKVVNYGVSDIYEDLIRLNEKDVVIAISFPRYAQKTYEAVEFLGEKGVKIIAISDNENAPINEFTEYRLIAKSNVYSFVDSLVAPLSLINALVISVGLRNIGKTKETFNELEEIWKDHYIYKGDEMEKEFTKGHDDQ
ncbi:SIS domain-containing protein [Acetobacterium fimetarium]|uniref:SIS domain-containing protein n=1 Tax=Acetobacterium fimetarium TaxID=52691 RepID=A0ABR6WSL9_9FIRM|nr:MurR/RpiR family transcriptional regulator [Acetobacterium fimetarium]MBC3803513.1 SIS domain-containing protein [Acetobacterium fimetarium]